jgi:hypothetical protein
MAKSSKKGAAKGKASEKSLANLKPFKPGQSGNPGGQPKVPDDLRKARLHNNEEVERSIHKFFNMTRGELRGMLEDDDTPVVDVLVGGIVAKAVSTACHTRATFLLERAGCRLPPHGALFNINLELASMSLEDLQSLAREAMEVLAESNGRTINITPGGESA